MNTGDIVTLGTWTQGESKEERSPIAWRVLEVRDGAALLLSDKAIDYQMYNDAFKAVSWRSCTLRRWLNGSFLESAFTPEERERILPTATDRDTEDSVFLLSREEAEELLTDLRAEPTEYANINGTYIRCEHARWWLRSRGNTPLMALLVSDTGVIFGLGVALKSVAVRPALRLRLD